ncbi:MAG: type II toxin-antitoxin system RelE/ParE family toxin [Fidelibacterota bacterium]
MYQLKQTRRFQKDFNKLETKEKNRITEKLSLLAGGKWKRLDIRKLKGTDECYRLRSGNYRVLLEKRKDELIIILLSVRHMKESHR